MKINLVLSGGGVRGFAHVGVIKVLEEAGYEIQGIAGTSSGAFFGALYASCGDARKVEAFVKGISLYKLFDMSLSRLGLMKGSKFPRLLLEFTQVKNIEDLQIPLAINATDILTGEEVIFRKGDLITALRASMGYPGLLTPVELDGRILLDGGLVNPVPLSLLPKKLPVLVCDVAVNKSRYSRHDSNVVDLLRQSINILQEKLIEKSVYHKGYRFVHLKPDLSDFDLFDIKNDPKIMRIGEGAARDALPELKKLCKAKPVSKTSVKKIQKNKK